MVKFYLNFSIKILSILFENVLIFKNLIIRVWFALPSTKTFLGHGPLIILSLHFHKDQTSLMLALYCESCFVTISILEIKTGTNFCLPTEFLCVFCLNVKSTIFTDRLRLLDQNVLWRFPC